MRSNPHTHRNRVWRLEPGVRCTSQGNPRGTHSQVRVDRRQRAGSLWAGCRALLIRGGGSVLIRKIAKGFGIFFVALLTVMVVGVGASGVARVQARQLAEPTGPSAVGRIELALTDAARVDPFAADGRRREIAVWIWYPTAEGGSGATAPYLPRTWADAANNVHGPPSV